MKTRISLLLSALITLTAIPTFAATGGEGKQLKPAKDDPAEAADLAKSARSPFVAATALGMLLELDNTPSRTVLDGLERFARKQFDKAAFLVAVRHNGPEFAKVLIAHDNKKLAAAILASTALAQELHSIHQQRVGTVKELKTGAGGKGRKGKKDKGHKAARSRWQAAAPPELTVPPELFADVDEETLEFAILAAAYAKDKSVADAVKNSKARKPHLIAAKFLYRCRTFGDSRGFKIAEVLKTASKESKPINKLHPDLYTWSPRAPAMCHVLQGLAALHSAANLSHVHNALKHPDIRVQIEAVNAINAIKSESSLKHLLQILPKCNWPVLVHVADTLGEMPSKDSIEPLLSRLREEKGRFRLDIIHALSSIAGDQKAESYEGWRDWWSKNKKSFKVDKQATQTFRTQTLVQDIKVPGICSFYGMTIVSDHFSFVLDSSLSMKGARIASLKENMKDTLNDVQARIWYNIVDFGGDISVMNPGRLTNSTSKGASHVYNMELTGQTRSFDAMERATLLPGVDTLIFLSDGAPTPSQIRAWPQIAEAMQFLNRYRPIALWMVDFDPSPSNMASMKQVARENFGMHQSQMVDAVDADKKRARR